MKEKEEEEEEEMMIRRKFEKNPEKNPWRPVPPRSAMKLHCHKSNKTSKHPKKRKKK